MENLPDVVILKKYLGRRRRPRKSLRRFDCESERLGDESWNWWKSAMGFSDARPL